MSDSDRKVTRQGVDDSKVVLESGTVPNLSCLFRSVLKNIPVCVSGCKWIFFFNLEFLIAQKNRIERYDGFSFARLIESRIADKMLSVF